MERILKIVYWYEEILKNSKWMKIIWNDILLIGKNIKWYYIDKKEYWIIL